MGWVLMSNNSYVTSVEFDDYFNDFQWSAIHEMLKGALTLKCPCRGEVNKDKGEVLCPKFFFFIFKSIFSTLDVKIK